jgi:hypothetical protein
MDKMLKFVNDPLFLALIVFILLFLLFDILKRLGRGRAWKQIAADTGLQFSKHKTATYRDQQLSGTYRKRPLAIIESVSGYYLAEQRRNWDRDTHTDTDIRMKINIPAGYKMGLNRVLTIGEGTYVTGNAEIDRNFNITSEPNWLAPKVLASPTVQQKLRGLKMGSSIFVQDATILFHQNGRISDGNYLRLLLDFLGDFADIVEAAATEAL